MLLTTERGRQLFVSGPRVWESARRKLVQVTIRHRLQCSAPLLHQLGIRYDNLVPRLGRALAHWLIPLVPERIEFQNLVSPESASTAARISDGKLSYRALFITMKKADV